MYSVQVTCRNCPIEPWYWSSEKRVPEKTFEIASIERRLPGTIVVKLVERRPDETDRRRQLIEITSAGTQLLEADRAERDAWLHATMRDNLSQLEFDLLILVAPLLRKLAYADAKAGTLAP